MSTFKKVKECFATALKEEKQGKKHKGLLIVKPNRKFAEEYLEKAVECLDLCELYKEKRADWKLPEEWYYALYSCALAILNVYGVESRSQKCTALFIKYLKEQDLIGLDDEFIDLITVHREKGKTSIVDEREQARYSPMIKNDNIIQKYDKMMILCKRCIEQTKNLIFSNQTFELPKELTDYDLD